MDGSKDTGVMHSAPQDVVPAPRRAIYHFKMVHIVYFIAGIIEVLLAFRLVFHLFAANPSSGIVMFIDGVTAPFMSPFTAIFPSSSFGAGVFEWPVLLAIAVYAVLAFGIVELINVFVARTPREEM
jgi:hypothetical protein